MGCVRDKTVPFLLGGLQTLHQIVEFIAQQSQLIIAADVHFVGVIPLLNNSHGIHDFAHSAGDCVGEEEGEQNQDGFQHQSNPKYGPL